MDAWLKLDALSREQLLELFSAAVDGEEFRLPESALRFEASVDPTEPPESAPPQLKLPTLIPGVQLRSEAHGELVADLQKFLIGEDLELFVDGIYGPQTATAVREFQQRHRLEVDGKVGPQTWGQLLAEGFRPQDYLADPSAYATGDPNWPPKPVGGRSPNGLELFGANFTYTPQPLKSMPEYVEPDPLWVERHISSVFIPQLIGVEGAPSDGRILFNQQLTEQVRSLFKLWEDLGLSDKVLTFAGSWVPRFIRGSRDKISNHALGSAFDINAAWNGYRRLPAIAGRKGSVRELVESAYLLGFYWGGWYNDGMHFEAYKVMSVEEIRRVREELLG